MNPSILIDNIVRQTTVLIAQLATAAGMRAPLASVANQIFVNLVEELRAQGVSQKVIADMFGLALRTYHDRVKRLSESATEQGRTLWEAVYSYILEEEEVKRAQVMLRFAQDDDSTVRGVLADIVSSGLVEHDGRGPSSIYRAVPPDTLVSTDDHARNAAANAALVWIAVYRSAPVSTDSLLHTVAGIEEDELAEVLDTLVADGRIQREDTDDGAVYHCEECYISPQDRVGWEAAVFDHYQAMITAVGRKLRLPPEEFARPDIGGCTYSFVLQPGHPLEDEVHALLDEVRTRASDLRQRVDSTTSALDGDEAESYKVVFYAGQTVVGDES